MKKFCEKKYVLFDFDGVIADTEESNGNYLGLALKEFGVELTQKDRDRLIGSHDSHILLELLERSPEKITMEQLLQKRKEIGNTYENGCIKPMDGVLEFIAGLKKQGKKLAVVSSTSTRLIVVALNRMKMLGLFDVLVCGDMCRNRKPDPECYRKAMQYLEAKPEECIAIEDSFIGIQAAKAANIEVVAYTGAGENQDVGKIFYSDKKVMAYRHLGIGRLIYQLPLPLCKMFIKEIFDDNTPDNFDEETLTTINKFFENNLNVSETSRQLYIHRNTLVYRLDKLQKSTGLDLRVFEDAITFRIALMVVKYMNYLETIEY